MIKKGVTKEYIESSKGFIDYMLGLDLDIGEVLYHSNNRKVTYFVESSSPYLELDSSKFDLLYGNLVVDEIESGSYSCCLSDGFAEIERSPYVILFCKGMKLSSCINKDLERRALSYFNVMNEKEASRIRTLSFKIIPDMIVFAQYSKKRGYAIRKFRFFTSGPLRSYVKSKIKKIGK